MEERWSQIWRWLSVADVDFDAADDPYRIADKGKKKR